MADKELVEELKALRKEVAGLRKDAKNEARRAKYDRLKAEGRLSDLPAIGRGMPRTPAYHEWDGLGREESEAECEYWRKNDTRIGGR